MKQKLSKELQQHLRPNVNVKLVTEYCVEFTTAFKELAWEQKEVGKPIREIFRENGIDPDLLGDKRVWNFSQMLNRRKREGKGFTDQRELNRRPTLEGEEESLETQVKNLRHELAYTRQEVEFLKKMQIANTEARSAWESKHRPK